MQKILANNPQLQYLFCSDIKSVPSEVLSRGEWDNCLPRLRSYLAEIEGETANETEIKVVLLGNGRIGKTQLCRRLRGERADFDLASTHGVELWREELTLQSEGETKTYWINWWDFGGQDIYHGTHALFLRTRAIFLLLWHPDYENTEEYEDHGIPMRNQPLAYWLDYIRSLAGEDSPVILVQSQCESFEQKETLPIQPEGVAFMGSCAFAAANDYGREFLEAHLEEAVRYLQGRTGDLKIGKGRAEVRERLFTLRQEDRDRPAGEKEHQTMTVETFQTLCEQVGGIPSWQHALDHFHQSGVVFHQPDIFRDLIILDQSWALDAIYTVFHRSSTLPVFRDHGAFSRFELEALVWQDRSAREQRLFLSMMESCGICFQYRKTAGKEEEPVYLAPDLLPPFDQVRSRSAPWQEDAEILTLRADYRFLHQTILRNLLSRLGTDAREAAKYWKYGLYLYDRNTRSQLLVREERPGRRKGPGSGTVVLQAQGQDPARLLRQAYKSFREQSFAEEPEISLTRDGETVALVSFEHEADGKVRTAEGRRVPAQPFRFLEDPRAQEGTIRERRPKIDAGPIEDSTPDRQIFISYAWGDPTEEGKIREKAVQGLHQALVGDGFQVIRDREELVPGDSIRDFMDRLAKGAHIVCVISDRYLRSANCMYELYRIWQRCGSDRRELAERIVPVILPQVEISDFLQRAPYLKHWKQKKDAFETLFRDPDLLPSAESLREVRLVREFAGAVDEILVFVNDILMPRNLGEHLDDGFQPVRDLLRKRLR